MQELEREPTDQEIMDALGMGKEEFGYSTLDKKALSLDAPLGEDGEGSLIDILDLNTERTDSALIRESLSKDLNSYMNLLSQRERDILNYYYGLNGEKPLILKDIASILRTTSERVRKQKEHAIRKLQKTTSKNNLRSYL
jgi:RNA polymerase primary sigma factor